MKYVKYQRNHVVVKGREEALDEFVNCTTVINSKRVRHKLKNSYSSNSEDALTWSCFDTLRSYKPENLVDALNEILEDSYDGSSPFDFKFENNIKVEISKEYIAPTLKTEKKKNEKTEVDASIETDDRLIFFEAKLYSLISYPSDIQKHNQIGNKLRIGLDYSRMNNKQFYFIFLDIAPLEMYKRRKPKAEADQASHNFESKWKSAWWFNYYRRGKSLKSLKEVFKDIMVSDEELIHLKQRMGWLTWASLFKIVLRAAIK